MRPFFDIPQSRSRVPSETSRPASAGTPPEGPFRQKGPTGDRSHGAPPKRRGILLIHSPRPNPLRQRPFRFRLSAFEVTAGPPRPQKSSGRPSFLEVTQTASTPENRKTQGVLSAQVGREAAIRRTLAKCSPAKISEFCSYEASSRFRKEKPPSGANLSQGNKTRAGLKPPSSGIHTSRQKSLTMTLPALMLAKRPLFPSPGPAASYPTSQRLRERLHGYAVESFILSAVVIFEALLERIVVLRGD
jgi:hypothetical protein